ncbi:MAG: orotidine-5'-phosphate decarboxylase [bacterium]
MKSAQEKFVNLCNKNMHICVGLDTDFDKIPDYLKKEKDPELKFNQIVIENTYLYAGSYKINFAFYEKMGLKGLDIIEKTLEFIPKDILTIGDAKRGDIGNTSQMYAKSIFEYHNFDSVTLNPYMGIDSVSPFLEYKDKINFILVLTSNKSSSDFEKMKLEGGKYLYQEVLDKVNFWDTNNNCGIVFGATNIEELKINISNFNKLFVLVPGVGAQGGSLEDVVSLFNQNYISNYMINISRSLLYCDNSIYFPSKIKETIISYNKIIDSLS